MVTLITTTPLYIQNQKYDKSHQSILAPKRLSQPLKKTSLTALTHIPKDPAIFWSHRAIELTGAHSKLAPLLIPRKLEISPLITPPWQTKRAPQPPPPRLRRRTLFPARRARAGPLEGPLTEAASAMALGPRAVLECLPKARSIPSGARLLSPGQIEIGAGSLNPRSRSN